MSIEKTSDTTYKKTIIVEQTFELKKRKGFLIALQRDIGSKQDEIIQLQNQVVDLEKEIKDVEDLGIKED